MKVQLAETRIEDYNFFQRVRIFFVQKRFKETRGDIVLYYKVYRNRKVLIREEWYK